MGLTITLLAVGTILVFIEAILPGMVAGILGVGSIIAGIYVAYRDLGMETGHTVLLSSVIGLLLVFVLWLKYFPRSAAGKLLVSDAKIDAQVDSHEALLGLSGVSKSRLAPSGFAVIDGKKIDVVSEVGFIEPGASIKVVDVTGNRIVVRPKA